MKKLIIAASLAATTLAGPALAAVGDSTGTVTIDGSVADRCLFTTPNGTISLGELSLSGSDTNPGKLNAAAVDGQSATLVGWCNGTSAKITVEAEAIVNSDFTGSPPSGFSRVINYTATANADGEDATDSSTDAGAGDPAGVGIFTGEMTVTLSNASAGSDLLVAGAYSGQVLVTLSPDVTPPSN